LLREGGDALRQAGGKNPHRTNPRRVQMPVPQKQKAGPENRIFQWLEDSLARNHCAAETIIQTNQAHIDILAVAIGASECTNGSG